MNKKDTLIEMLEQVEKLSVRDQKLVLYGALIATISSMRDAILVQMLYAGTNGVQKDVPNDVPKEEGPLTSPCFPPNESEESSKEGKVNNPLYPPSCSEEENLRTSSKEDAQRVCRARERKDSAHLRASFEAFWEAYDYKRGKERAYARWVKLTDKEREAATAAIPAYKEDCHRHQRQLLYPQGYLNQKRFNDDFSSGQDNLDIIHERIQRPTREDMRRREQQQRLEGYAAVAAKFRNQSGH